MHFPSAEKGILCHCRVSATAVRLAHVSITRLKRGNLDFLHAWQEAKSNLFITASSHMQSLRWGTISSRADLSSASRCYPLAPSNIRSRWADRPGETPGVDLNSLSLHCPPVSAIQPNEVIIEPDTNTHWVPLTVVFHHLESATNQGRTPLSKWYLLRMREESGEIGRQHPPTSSPCHCDHGTGTRLA